MKPMTSSLLLATALVSSPALADSDSLEGTFCLDDSDAAVLFETSDASLVWTGTTLMLRDADGALQWMPMMGSWPAAGNRLCLRSDGNLELLSGNAVMWDSDTENDTIGTVALLAPKGAFYGYDFINADRRIYATAMPSRFHRTENSDGTVSFKSYALGTYMMTTLWDTVVASTSFLSARAKFIETEQDNGSVTLTSVTGENIHAVGGNSANVSVGNVSNMQDRIMVLNAESPTATVFELDGCELLLRSDSGKVLWSVGGDFCAPVDPSLANQCSVEIDLPTGMLSESDDWTANSDFQAGYSFAAGIVQTEATSVTIFPGFSIEVPEAVWFGGKGDAYAKVFGERATLFDVEGSGHQIGDERGSTGYLEVMGAVIYDEPLEVAVDFVNDQDFFEAKKTIFLVVTVRAAITGYIGIRGVATVEGLGAAINITPYTGVVGTISASIDALCASAGVAADLTIIGVELPVDGGIYYDATTSGIGWTLDANLEIESLSGEVYVYYEACGLADDSETLFDWDGLNIAPIELLSESGCF